MKKIKTILGQNQRGVIYSQKTKQFVADCTSNPEDVKNDTANAEFILYAVNNIERIIKQRDELLEGVKIFKELMTNFADDFRIETKDIAATILAETMIDKFKQAIANAEESK